jgi:uncharacterized protein
MLKFTTFVLGMLTFAVAARSADVELPHITVYGTATTQVVPDQMLWSLTVRNQGSTLPTVAEQHATIVRQVRAFLRDAGIKEADVQMANMEFGENWEYRSSSRVMEGYFASTVVTFRTADLKAYKHLWIGLAGIPGVTVDRVAYDHSKRIGFQNETRRNALLKAKEKALDLAKTLGSEIGEPLLIEEDLWASEGWSASNPASNLVLNNVANQNSDAAKTDVAPGRIPIRMRVKVSFRLITHSK